MKTLEKDAGFSIMELMVTILLLGVVSGLVLAGVQNAVRVMRFNDDSNRGLADAKTVLDRLARDVREAREVTCDGGLSQLDDPTSSDPACQAHLQLWIDDNSDYVQQTGEVVTWRLARSPDGAHYDVIRYQGTSTAGGQVEARSLIMRTLFRYYKGGCPAPGGATPANVVATDATSADVVQMTIQYDPLPDQGTAPQSATTCAKLRNVG